MQDETPRNSATALFAQDDRFHILVNSIKDYAIYLLDRDGYINSWNAGAERFKGYKADEVIGEHFSRFYTEEDREAQIPNRALQLAADNGGYEAEGWRVRKDGTRFWAHVIIDAIYDETNELVGFAKITRDISDRKRAQEELERNREAVSQSQKLEAIGRVTGGVAHDFNNLLTVIRSSAELLLQGNLNEEKRIRYIKAIAETADRAALLTGQLLAFARQQPLRPEVFNVAERVEALSRIIDTTLGSPIKLEAHFPADLAAVEADPAQFDTSLLNMVINARDAMPNGGSLYISARNVSEIPPIRRHAGAFGDFVAITIEDTGEGIPKDVLERIFEPFYTTKGVNKGTGLGLSQVYGFAKQSGGEIDVKSEPGKGTAFTLYLPRAKATSQPVAPSTPYVQSATPSRSLRILLVEDNDTVGQFALNLMTELGHDVTLAPEAHAALQHLRERRGEFDLVFSDVVMPGITGVELGQEIRRHWPDLRVVLTTGYSHVLAEQQNHGFELLRKPYSLEDLLALFRG